MCKQLLKIKTYDTFKVLTRNTVIYIALDVINNKNYNRTLKINFRIHTKYLILLFIIY